MYVSGRQAPPSLSSGQRSELRTEVWDRDRVRDQDRGMGLRLAWSRAAQEPFRNVHKGGGGG